MLKPPASTKQFEKVRIKDFINGTIADIQHDEKHKFKGYNGAEDSVGPAVRFVFELDGYAHKHYSRWMRFSYHEKSGLYQKYIMELVEGAVPDLDFDLEQLKGMKVRTMWDEKNDFQSIKVIFPLEKKIAPRPENTLEDDIDVARSDEPPLEEPA